MRKRVTNLYANLINLEQGRSFSALALEYSLSKSTSFVLAVLSMAAIFLTAQITHAETSFEIYSRLLEQSTTLKAQPIYIENSSDKRPITFGGEKEGSSALLTRIAGPKQDELITYFNQNQILAKSIMERFLMGQIMIPEVTDKNGQIQKPKIDFTLNELTKAQINSKEMIKLIGRFVRGLGISPFSFLTYPARKEIFDHDKANPERPSHYPSQLRQYEQWMPILGEAEKYILSLETTGSGWEIQFQPQKSYGEFEKMNLWFRTTLGGKYKLFEAPGHQWLVLPTPKFNRYSDTISNEKLNEFHQKSYELFRWSQAYILITGLTGKTGVLQSYHKEVLDDNELSYRFKKFVSNQETRSDKGIISIGKSNLFDGSLELEQRAGTKDFQTRNFLQTSLAARLANQDFSGISDFYQYSIFPHFGSRFTYFGDRIKNHLLPILSQQSQDTMIPEDLYVKVTSQLRRIKKTENRLDITRIPLFWNWNDVPFLQGKIHHINNLTRQALEKIAALPNPDMKQLEVILRQWARATNIQKDIENYLRPKNLKVLDYETKPHEVPTKQGKFNVNDIPIGNEFTTRFPIKLVAEYDENKIWKSTTYDLDINARAEILKKYAETLKEQLTGSKEGVKQLDQGSHGHDFVLAFSFKDSEDRDWRVEWDGVSRNYDQEGTVAPESARGGHIEVVSPKYQPTFEEIGAVYTAMEINNLIPEARAGGAHINIDYSYFEKHPEALARFLTLLHSHRGVISFLFQHPNRLRASEPVRVSANLDLRLRSFTGTKTQLAQLLYNEKYFNPRFNRKTRYTQFDLSNFMADVIPDEFKKPDFDVVKANQTGKGWEYQFRVTDYTKAELRLFDAPRDAIEASLQIKLVRALLDLAINETAPIETPVQNVNHEAFVKDLDQAKAAFLRTMKHLNLPAWQYEGYFQERMVLNREFIKSKFYKPWPVVAAERHPVMNDWKTAVGTTEATRQAGQQRAIENRSSMKSQKPETLNRNFQIRSCKAIYSAG